MKSLETVQHLLRLISVPHTIPPRDLLEAVLDLAANNSLLLAAYAVLDTHEALPKDHRKPYQQIQRLQVNSYKLFQEFQDLCSSEGLLLFTIKSFLPFPYVDSNVDIVAVNVNEIERYRRLIQKLGFQRLHNLADCREPLKEMYYHSDRKSDYAFPKLHLHRAISWNGVVYLDLPQVWHRHVYHLTSNGKILVPSPEDEILIMAAHAMFENKYITLCDLVYLQQLATQKTDWDYVFGAAQDKSWYKALNIFLVTAYNLGQALDLDIRVENIAKQASDMQSQLTTFPWVLPLSKTLGAGMAKLSQDLRRGQIKKLSRKILTYFLVDPLWMYRKARRKANKSC